MDSSYWLLDSLFLMIGLGLGLNMQTMLIAVQNAVPARDMGVATSSATFFRQLGGTLGVAVFISLLFNSLPRQDDRSRSRPRPPTRHSSRRWAAAGATTPQQAQELLAGYGAQMQTNSSFLQQIDPALALPFQQGFVDSTHLVYIVAGIIMFIAFLLVLDAQGGPVADHVGLAGTAAGGRGADGRGRRDAAGAGRRRPGSGRGRTGAAAEETPVGPPSPVTHGRHGLDEANSDPTEGPGKHAG